MPEETLQDIIHNFSPEKFIKFFSLKSRAFRPKSEEVPEYNDDQFTHTLFLGEIHFNKTDRLVVYSFKVNEDLTERSGKKAQYEKGKRILKVTNSDAGIFIFYNQSGRFRFSLITVTYTGTKRQFSHYKRYTYFVSPELTNKTFLKQIGEADFSSIENIRDAFSIEPVTKQFYNELQNWYFWAMDRIRFPEDYRYSHDPEKDREIRNATNLIRLITRIIFIWFLKEKGLIPPQLFSETELRSIVKDFMRDKHSSNYYNAILQNLFFATLNQKMGDRRFASEEGYPSNKKEYGVKTLFRYADMFLIDKQKVLNLFRDIPFLNGGLFDCLDKEDEEGRVIYIDGFSRNPKKRALIPDYLFFQKEEQRIDLSVYGLGSNKPVRGLIEIIQSYNFTIDENTPVDQEVALDPELLGKVFENLLASYNPETATTARKATGSYYTPREIVDYMVEESIYEYLKTRLPDIDDERLRILLSYSEEVPEFGDKEKQRIISAIDNIKILDPACGSGAFPMGVLHKLVHVLQRLDPNNGYWRKLQYQKALKESEEVFKKDDKTEREEMLREINEAFDESINYPDFARKLYLIENCIYGVDIQPIAIQIAKLRFFISLVLDQKVDRTKENFGIRALPNLETRFVSANTLIGLERPIQTTLLPDDIRKLEEEIQVLRHRYFQAKTRTEKQRLQKKDRELRETLAERLESLGFPHDSAEKIARFDLFDQNASSDWFDPEWMFGIKTPSPLMGEGRGEGGFDIVIANPPYIQLQKDGGRLAKLFQNQGYETFARTGDIYTLFYEKGLDLLKENGILTYITSNKWMRAGYGEKTRAFFTKYNPLVLIDLGPGVFESATVDTNILIIQKANNKQKLLAVTLQKENSTVDIAKQLSERGVILNKLTRDAWFIGSSAEQRLKEKIERIGKPLKDWDVNIYYGIKTGLNEAFIIDSQKREEILNNCHDEAERQRTEAIIKPILRGRDIKRYYYEWAGFWVIWVYQGIDIDKYTSLLNHLIPFKEKLSKRTGGAKVAGDPSTVPYKWYELQVDSAAHISEFEKEKVVWKALSLEPAFCYIDSVMFNNDKANFLTSKQNDLKYLTGYLNSKIFQFLFSKIGINMGHGYEYKIQFLEKIPLPPITASNQGIVSQIEDLVDKILSAKKQNPSANTQEWEREIDRLVYKLYDLTEEEIRIVEK